MRAAFDSKGARMFASDLLTQPYSAMELAAFFAALMAALFVALWQRDREPGMAWFALSMALLAAWLGANRWHLPVGEDMPRSVWSRGAGSRRRRAHGRTGALSCRSSPAGSAGTSPSACC